MEWLVGVVFEYLFEYLLYDLGVKVVSVLTLGKVRPQPNSNPYYFSFVGLIFVIVVIGILVFALKNNA
ncbi:MAG: hypothetical protein PHU06_10915 [Gallionella sp.]|nr:hypothetical protein [Gallionella sp.]MDD4959166.1 hypothetical protein [Gallionella sp.]